MIRPALAGVPSLGDNADLHHVFCSKMSESYQWVIPHLKCAFGFEIQNAV